MVTIELIAALTKGNEKHVELLWNQMNHCKIHPSIWYQLVQFYKNEGNDDQVLKLYREYESLFKVHNDYLLNLVMLLDASIINVRISKICEYMSRNENQKRTKQSLFKLFISGILFKN